MPLRLIPDFDDDSRNGARCSVNGTIKQPGDPGVFRGPLIDFEGYFDICADVIREAAHDLGLLPEDVVAEIAAERDNLQAQVEALEDLVANLNGRCQQLVLMNAELIDAYEDGEEE